MASGVVPFADLTAVNAVHSTAMLCCRLSLIGVEAAQPRSILSLCCDTCSDCFVLMPLSQHHVARDSSGGRVQAGRALLTSIADLSNCNAWSRIPQSPYGSMDSVRSWLLACIKVCLHHALLMLHALPRLWLRSRQLAASVQWLRSRQVATIPPFLLHLPLHDRAFLTHALFLLPCFQRHHCCRPVPQSSLWGSPPAPRAP